MNHLKLLDQLNNQYFILRHGESKANQQNLIVSSPDNGIDSYGLSEKGQKQVRDSIRANSKIKNVSKIISSDFLRAFESAETAQKLLNANIDIQINRKLRERFFGDYELQSNTFYETAWAADQLDSSNTKNKVESADAVMERTTSFILSLEENFEGEVFLLASHGDTLQILETAFNKKGASLHRSLPDLNTAEIRELILKR